MLTSRRGLLALAALALAVAPVQAAGLADDLAPLTYAVCVTTIDAGGAARFDSYYNDLADARARRAEILRDGWVKSAPFPDEDEEDEYPPRSIVKATVDESADESVCTAPLPTPRRSSMSSGASR